MICEENTISWAMRRVRETIGPSKNLDEENALVQQCQAVGDPSERCAEGSFIQSIKVDISIWRRCMNYKHGFDV